MAVKTPELEEPVYAQQQQAAGAVPPMAQGEQAQQLPPGAGFVSKGGAAAYVANSVIDGWLKGRQIAAVRNMQTAQNEISTTKHAYDVLAQNYKNIAMQKGEDSPEARQAYQTAAQNWNEYNQVRAKYAIPDKGSKPQKGSSSSTTGPGKAKGDGFKGALGNWAGQMFGKSGVQPHMFAEAALKMAENNPEGLALDQHDRLGMEELKQAKSGTELNELQIKEAKLKLENQERENAEGKRVDAILLTPEKDRKPGDVEFIDLYHKKKHFDDPELTKMQDAVLVKMRNHEKLDPTEQNFAISQRLVEGPHSIQFNDGLTTYTAMQMPDGSITSKVKLGRVFHEDEAAVAARSQMLLHNLKVDEFVRSGMPRKEAEQAALLEEARNPGIIAQFIGNNPIAEERNKKAVSDALRTVWNNAGGMGADSQARGAAQAVLTNFITGDPKGAKGYVLFRNQVADPASKGGWFSKDKYAGGITKDKLTAAQAALYNEVRQTIHEQHPEMTPLDLDQAMPEWLKSPEGRPPTEGQGQAGAQPKTEGGQGMPEPPKGNLLGGAVGLAALPGVAAKKAVEGVSGLFTAPPRDMTKSGKNGAYGEMTKETKVYRVQTNDHGWVRINLTPQEAEERKQAGHQVEEANTLQ